LKKEMLSTTLLTLLILMLTLGSSRVAFSQETPLVYVDPATVTGLSPSQSFTVTVRIANVTNLYGFDVQFHWDSTLLDYVSHTAKLPVDTYPEGVLYNPIISLKNEANATAGTYWLAASSLYPAPSFNGTGIFFEITFQVKAIGQCLLEIYSSDLADVGGQAIAHNVEHGFFSNYVPTPATIHVNPNKVIDVALIPCNNFTVDVDLEDVVDLETLEFWLSYDTLILDVVHVNASTVFSPPATIDISEPEGRLRVAASTSPSITGDFTLATVTFHVTGTGESVLDLYNVTLVDEWGASVPYLEPGDGYFSNILKAKLFIDPPELIDPTLTPGSKFTIDVQIDDVFDLYGYAFHLAYDTNVLTALGVVISPPTNDTHFTTEVSILDELGHIYVNVTYYPPATPISISSNTTLVTIHFLVEGYGCTVLDLYDTVLVDPFGASIPHEVGDGFFCTLIADVAIVDIELSKNFVYASCECPWHTLVNVTVVATNLGDTTETFNVTAYYDNNTIGTKPVVDLLPGWNASVVFVWDTTGLPPCSNYTISAEASIVPYELDEANNVYSDGWVKMKIVGDVNNDGQVDIFDIVLASDAYSTVQGDPDYNPEADVAPQCGRIDIYDMVTIASHYGEGC
jgi:hypothetical protein